MLAGSEDEVLDSLADDGGSIDFPAGAESAGAERSRKEHPDGTQLRRFAAAVHPFCGQRPHKRKHAVLRAGEGHREHRRNGRGRIPNAVGRQGHRVRSVGSIGVGDRGACTRGAIPEVPVEHHVRQRCNGTAGSSGREGGLTRIAIRGVGRRIGRIALGVADFAAGNDLGHRGGDGRPDV